METLAIVPATVPITGTARVPGSKSITNRALVLAALSDGPTTLAGALFADDTARMTDCLGALGFEVEAEPAAEAMTVWGRGGVIPAPRAELFVGNSGTTARFITPVLALGRGEYIIDGVARMRERPIGDLLRALRQLDVDAESIDGNGCPPLRVRAKGLRGGVCSVRADMSSQFLSGLLLAVPLASGGESLTRILVDGPLMSAPYVAMTIEMMQSFGARVEVSGSTAQIYEAAAEQAYRSPRLYSVEPDASAASYFWAAAAMTGGSVRIDGIGNESLQGDVAFVDVLEAMGCRVLREAGFTEVSGTGALQGGTFDMNAISDTVMTLAAVAPFADSPTRIENVAHIRHKETDRLHAVAAELTRLGVEVEERADGMTIYPASRIAPGTVETYDDHRMAMAFALIGLRAPGIHISNPQCVAKTFPDYFVRLEALVTRSVAA